MGLLLFVMSSVALASDPVVKQVNFNKAKNSIAVQLENGETKNFEAKECVLKLDSTAKMPTLIKGTHLYYVVFPNVESLKDTLN